MEATNTILLDENVGGKGRQFKTRFLQAGLVKYSFGVCLLEKEVIDKFVYQFVGCPVIINHKDVTDKSAKDDRVGVISDVWFDEADGWYWGKGIIFEQEALNLIEKNFNVSCQYLITEYAENREHKLHNGNEYDKTILNGRPEHLAIVENPRYENAMIAVNAMENEVIKADNGFITLDELDEDGNRKVIWIPGNVISKTAKNDIIQAINEIKGTKMFMNLFKKKENKMDKEEMKDLFMECLTELTATNEKEVEEDKTDYKKLYNELKEKVENKCKNEEVVEEKEEEKEVAENKKAKNDILSGVAPKVETYITERRARELGKELF